MRAVLPTAGLCARCARQARLVAATEKAATRAFSSRASTTTATTTTTARFRPIRRAIRPAPTVSSSTALRPPSSRLFASSTSSASSPDQTYYALFPSTLPSGPPPSGPFQVDTRALRREFLALQSAAHPDAGGGGDTSAALNAAYKTLCSPLLRARHLLQTLHGVDLEADDMRQPADAVLLTTVLEAHDALEEATEEGQLEGLKRENDDRMRESEEVLARCFAEGDVKGAVEEAVRLRYWVNIDEGIREWEGGKGVRVEH